MIKVMNFCKKERFDKRMEPWTTFARRLRAVGAYREFLRLPPVQMLQLLIEELASDTPDGDRLMDHFAGVFYELQRAGWDSLGGYLWEHLRYDETPYGMAAASGTANPSLTDAARQDIETFAALASLDGETWRQAIAATVGEKTAALLPLWRADDTLSFDALNDAYRRDGAGAFARHKAFLWTGHTLLPVADPDLEEYALIGYEDERREVWDNTRALLSGCFVNNMLLYGAAGTGKSATVKSLLREPDFGDLRIIELDKQQLSDIPALVRRLAGLRQKFILFIDDLSFETADVGYSVLKTVLEGSIEKRPANVVIYATSNRRHLMRETFSERGDDEVHLRESIAERTALSERFGIRVLFRSLNKDQYLSMVHTMAEQAGLVMEEAALEKAALQWEREQASRTPRSARQLVQYLLSQQNTMKP